MTDVRISPAEAEARTLRAFLEELSEGRCSHWGDVDDHIKAAAAEALIDGAAARVLAKPVGLREFDHPTSPAPATGLTSSRETAREVGNLLAEQHRDRQT